MAKARVHEESMKTTGRVRDRRSLGEGESSTLLRYLCRRSGITTTCRTDHNMGSYLRIYLMTYRLGGMVHVIRVEVQLIQPQKHVKSEKSSCV